MLQLANMSNYEFDRRMIDNSAVRLESFLKEHALDGLEMLFWEDWDPALHRKPWIQGAHLRFWPNWLDFWRGDRQAVLSQLGGEEQVFASFGSWDREDWLERYRREIAVAADAGAKYLVFHVSQVRPDEMYDWRFTASDKEVIDATLEVVNELSDAIPSEIELLYENLWWPGLTLRDPEIASRLLSGSRHSKTGFMLDTGHLMNGNISLHNQDQAIDYTLKILERLGGLKASIRGMHLHHSLSGQYLKESRKQQGDFSLTALMSHVMKIDQHLPFSSERVKELVNAVKPAYLVHEFAYSSLHEWSDKIRCQQQALGELKVEEAS